MKKILLLATLCLPLLYGGCVKRVVSNTITFYGFVTDFETSEPLQGVKVTVLPNGQACSTGSDGTYEIKNVPYEEGGYVLQAQKDGYQSNRVKLGLISTTNKTEVSIQLHKEQN